MNAEGERGGDPMTDEGRKPDGKELIAKYGQPRKYMAYYLGSTECTKEEYEAAIREQEREP